ncbi:MAG: peroxiredoxin [Fulvimonas sp.]|jgi:peroxiredoxin Q/BCP|nr:peroxiredoxin [Fulvimonas sp.]
MPEIGTKVEDLEGVNAAGETVRLSDFKGRWLVVYFYPKDATSGCTLEAQSFRDLYPEFRRRGAEIIGVSRDSVHSHARFAAKQALPFTLIADTDERWCRAFDVLHEKVLYGKRHLGVVRSTFLIDPEGHLVREWRNVKVPGHAQAVLEAIPAQ